MTALISGDLVPAMRLFKDMLYEFDNDGKISLDDVVHVILPCWNLKNFFEGVGFKEVAFVSASHVDPILQQTVNKGGFRLAARFSDLLDRLAPYEGGNGHSIIFS